MRRQRSLQKGKSSAEAVTSLEQVGQRRGFGDDFLAGMGGSFYGSAKRDFPGKTQIIREVFDVRCAIRAKQCAICDWQCAIRAGRLQSLTDKAQSVS
jgi:hypothetical protein